MITTGLESLLQNHLDDLRGARVGVLANHASVTASLVHIVDALSQAGIKISAMYGPEHGVRGDLAEGAHVEDCVDERLRVPVYSLYGVRKTPSPENLADVDIMLVDLQDIGSRFYTFLYTVGDVMRACGECGIPVWVLDRPNPISGCSTEGPVSRPEFSYTSFGGSYALPIRHGLTMGELARLFVARDRVSCDLRVVPMDCWRREMYYEQTGLQWVMPSPNVPTVDTALVYPGLCLIEGTNLSEGRGTTRPFELFGAPWLDAARLKRALDEINLPGAAFREAYFTPNTSKHSQRSCAGLQVHVMDRTRFQPVLTGIAVVSCLLRIHPEEFEFRKSGEKMFFDILCGTDSVRAALSNGASSADVAESWKPGLNAFREDIQPILLY